MNDRAYPGFKSRRPRIAYGVNSSRHPATSVSEFVILYSYIIELQSHWIPADPPEADRDDEKRTEDQFQDIF